MKLRPIAAAVCSAALVLVTACSSNQGAATSDPNVRPSGGPSGTKIVVATNGAGGGRGEWLKSEAAKAGFNIEVVSLGGADLTARVVKEVANPTINVAFGPSDDQFTFMKDANALVEYTPVWADKVDKSLYEDDKMSYPYEVAPKLWMVNDKVVPEADQPKSIKDLYTNPKLCHLYTVPTSFSGTTDRAIVTEVLAQYRDDSTDTGISQAGWDALQKFMDCGYQTPKGEDAFKNMATGKVPITYSFSSGIPGKIDTANYTPKLLYFTEGQPTNTNHMGIVKVKDAAQIEESKRFVDWLGSAQTIGADAAAHGILPVNQDAVSQALPVIQDIAKNYKKSDIDWAWANGKLDDWVSKIQLEILK